MKLNRRQFIKVVISTGIVAAIPLPVHEALAKSSAYVKFYCGTMPEGKYILSYWTRKDGEEYVRHVKTIALKEEQELIATIDMNDPEIVMTMPQLEPVKSIPTNFISNNHHDGSITLFNTELSWDKEERNFPFKGVYRRLDRDTNKAFKCTNIRRS